MIRPVIGVVVPARDERERLGGCVAALSAAAEAVAPEATVRVVVVLDGCRDGSAARVPATAATVRAVLAHNVGLARAIGAAELLDGPVPADWIATTDADSRVPVGWLRAHAAAWRDGDDALLGTVTVADWETHPPRTRAWFSAVHRGGADTHPHVHGANLGVRAATYRTVGGFPPLASGEDVGLVERLERAGARLRRTRAVPVATSARPVGRAPAGFSQRLRSAGVSLDAGVGNPARPERPSRRGEH